MRSIGDLANSVIKTSISTDLQPSSAPARVVRYDASNLPAWHNRVTDLDIPRRVWSAWVPRVGQRAIIRALFADERRALKARADDLRPALQPYNRQHDGDRVAGAIASMFGGFPSMRQRAENALGRVDSAMRILAEFPAWAIEEACAKIQRDGYEVDDDGVKRTEKHWPPGDPEIVTVVRHVMRFHSKALASAEALLIAPVDESENARPLTKEEIEAKLGRPLDSEKRKPGIWEDSQHGARVKADLEARRQRRETEGP